MIVVPFVYHTIRPVTGTPITEITGASSSW
jgi:hypothetical protein